MKLGRNPVGGVYQPGRVEHAVRLNLPADGGRAVKDHGGLLEATEDPACHRLEPAWPGFALRLQQTAKCIQVVAENAGTVRRQNVYELGITVIADMKEIEIARPRAEVARVVPKSVRQSIRVDRGATCAQPRQTAQPPLHRRTD